LCAPLLLSGVFLAGVTALHVTPGTAAVRGYLSWVFIHGLLPLYVGFLAAGLGAHEAAGELPFALPVSYRRIALARLNLLLGAGVMGVVTSFTVADVQRAWPVTAPFAALHPVPDVLECVGCLLALWGCVAVGWGSAALVHSATVSRLLVAALGLVGLVASAHGGSWRAWVTLQSAWLLIGVAALCGGWWRVRAPEWTGARMEEQA
jgi:hypothetical protein